MGSSYTRITPEISLHTWSDPDVADGAIYHYFFAHDAHRAQCKCCGQLESTYGAYCVTCSTWSCMKCVWESHPKETIAGVVNRKFEAECKDCIFED